MSKLQAKLLVPNALESAKWKNNPDVKLNMISYLGFPVNWPDGKPFGTICTLDTKKNIYSSEFENLLKKFRDLLEKYLEIIEINNQLKILSETDPLTGVFNRRGFFHRAELEIERAIRYKGKLSLLILDIDNFKQINDRFGHQTGDIVLKELAKTIKKSLRRSDICGRLGGDEFVIMFPETSIDAAQVSMERMRAKLGKIRIPHEYEDFIFTVSMGISEFFYTDTVDTIFNRADKALYRAKETQSERKGVLKNEEAY